MTATTSPADGTVLVTGGAGFIGCAMSAALADRFGRVVALDSLHPQVHARPERPAALDPRVELHVGDVTDPDVWDALLPGVRPDVVVHLAAETGTGQSLTHASRHASVNVVGTARMLDALVAHDALPRRVVLASSRAVYGEGAWRLQDGTVVQPPQRTAASLAAGEWDVPGATPLPMRADRVPPAPVSVYGATKLAQEHVLTSWARALGVEPVVLRLQNVYGPGQSLSNPYTGIVSLFCRMARAGRSIPLYEDGEVRRDFVLVDDVARALVAATHVPGVGPEPVDVGSGEHQTIGRAAAVVAARYGAPAPHVTGQFREGDVRHAWADVERAATVLGWRAEHDLESGIDRLVRWIETQELPDLPPA